jgi:protein-S-isoprenylcysteine O-methyltransferase Ste14
LIIRYKINIEKIGVVEVESMKYKVQQILGYLVGGLLVLVLIPFGIYSAAKYFDPLYASRIFAETPLRIALVVVLFLVGATFGIWSIVVQNTIGGGGPVQIGRVDISPKTQHLVVVGPYKYTRNPMLFGACLMYWAFAAYLNSITAGIVVILFMGFMLIFVKLSEEKRLLKDFGESYEQYRKNVSMFIPWFPKR